MKRSLIITSLAFAVLGISACGLIDDLEDVIDPPPKVVEVDHQFIPCAQDSTQAADTANYSCCSADPMPVGPGAQPFVCGSSTLPGEDN